MLRLPRPSPRLWLMLLLLLVGGVLALIEQRNSLESAIGTQVNSGEPDYYLDGADMTRFDARGVPFQDMTSPHIEHTPEDDVTIAQAPKIRTNDSEDRRWYATGKRGVLSAGGDTFTLEGNAQLRQPSDAWTLDTDVLNYSREQNRAWSDVPVVITQNGQHIESNSFSADLSKDSAVLDGRVRGTLQPGKGKSAASKEAERIDEGSDATSNDSEGRVNSTFEAAPEASQ
ncbi:LPS export ABC transporter periplasmic protein LptC [Cobetia crustatorum]|uniref:LPS export ABC transporter periplasmic protein LptC n=1 Tax=Cobetia crustatorum TaxID=553385 RepID=A0A558HXW1_9GAMM|nr:LPS export ABC transporter periplasmic protein LptC [Cobetia crustatorum]TVU73929.1 LPS export ABC transporter periplasmic protein LptC [Cobetia crustatorum]